jgi:hypothetical protein
MPMIRQLDTACYKHALFCIVQQAQKRPKVFGWAQIIYLLNIEQSCIWLAQT